MLQAKYAKLRKKKKQVAAFLASQKSGGAPQQELDKKLPGAKLSKGN